MSVLIKGMQMPKKGCCSCPLRTGRYCGQMTENELVQQYVERYERHPDCPLVEVPSDEETQKKGKWISFGEYKMGRYAGWICSNCETFFDDSKANLYIRCPKCGAYMEE